MAKAVSTEPTTHHAIVVQGRDRLSLTDEDGQHVVAARRVDGIWHISADGVEDGHADNVHDAILQMTEHALAFKQNELGPDKFAAKMATIGHPDTVGYSTFVPHEARKLDGKESFDDWKADVALHHLTF